MGKKRNGGGGKKSKKQQVAHARLEDPDNETSNGAADGSSGSSPRNKWKGPKWNKKSKGKNKGKKGNNNFNNNVSTFHDEHFRRAIESDQDKTVIEMSADGNCLFRSLSDQMYHDWGDGHEQVREELASAQLDLATQEKEQFPVQSDATCSPLLA